MCKRNEGSRQLCRDCRWKWFRWLMDCDVLQKSTQWLLCFSDGHCEGGENWNVKRPQPHDSDSDGFRFVSTMIIQFHCYHRASTDAVKAESLEMRNYSDNKNLIQSFFYSGWCYLQDGRLSWIYFDSRTRYFCQVPHQIRVLNNFYSVSRHNDGWQAQKKIQFPAPFESFGSVVLVTTLQFTLFSRVKPWIPLLSWRNKSKTRFYGISTKETIKGCNDRVKVESRVS